MNNEHILLVGLIAMFFGACTLVTTNEHIPVGKTSGHLKWYQNVSMVYGLAGLIGGFLMSLFALGILG